MENQPALDMLWRARARWKLHPRQFTGDTTYGTAENIVALEEQQIRAYVPLPHFDQRTEFFGQRDFRYESDPDVYICPNGVELHYSASSSTEDYRRYWAKAKECNACPLKAQCTTSSRGRRLSRHVDEEYLERVREYHATEAYKKAMRKRSVRGLIIGWALVSSLAVIGSSCQFPDRQWKSGRADFRHRPPVSCLRSSPNKSARFAGGIFWPTATASEPWVCHASSTNL